MLPAREPPADAPHPHPRPREDNTILGGVIELVHHGAWDIAFVVFFASVVIPISKFVVILYLVASIRFPRLSVHARIHLYEVVEFIGRWSMIDVFVVAILTALVQLGFLASINPGRRRSSSRSRLPLPCSRRRLSTRA